MEARARRALREVGGEAAALHNPHAPRHASVRENIMVRTELRIVLAVIATFVVLAGIGVAIHGMLFDQSRALFYGALAIVVGATTSVIALNVWPNDQT
jgi:hypothetical protein